MQTSGSNGTFEYSLTGGAALIARLTALSARVREAAAAAMYQDAEETMTISKGLVPVDTGTLRASGFVEPPEITADNIIVRMGYGGAASDYALKVHERTDISHKVGQAKYLSDPFFARSAGFAERFKDRFWSKWAAA